MRSATFSTRIVELLGRLSIRIEGQTFRKGADAPHCVVLVGTFDELAGRVERELVRPARDLPTARARIMHDVRQLRRIVAVHDAVTAPAR